MKGKGKKILIHLAAWFLFVVVSCINVDAGAALFLFLVYAYMILGIVWLVKRKKRKAAAKKEAQEKAPQPAPAPAPVQQKKTSLPYAINGQERRYMYTAVGVYVPYLEALAGLEEGAAVTLRQDKENQHDNKAVAVSIGGQDIGFLYRGKLQDMANDWMKTERPILAMVDTVTPAELKIKLCFYDEPRLQRMQAKNPNPKAYKLTRCYSAATQDAICTLDEWIELDIEEDYESGGYNASYLGDYVGHLPAAAADLIEKWGGEDNCTAYVANVDMNDKDKYTISIYLYEGK